MLEQLKDKEVIVKIKNIVLGIDAKIGYNLSFVMPDNENYKWSWFVTEDILDKDFLQISDNNNIKFILMEE